MPCLPERVPAAYLSSRWCSRSCAPTHCRGDTMKLPVGSACVPLPPSVRCQTCTATKWEQRGTFAVGERCPALLLALRWEDPKPPLDESHWVQLSCPTGCTGGPPSQPSHPCQRTPSRWLTRAHPLRLRLPASASRMLTSLPRLTCVNRTKLAQINVCLRG